MSHRQLKAGYFVLTWVNIYAVCYYFNYVFFHLTQDFGFSNRENLMFAALNGLIYVPASWLGGQFAQKFGYVTALKLGFGAMAILLALGTCFSGITVQVAIMVSWTIAVCLTWAPLEALASHNESRRGLADMIGVYNVVWSSGAAIAFFTGGALQSALGKASLYWLPALLHALQLIFLLWLERQARIAEPTPNPEQETKSGEPMEHQKPGASRVFLRMAWLANPFAYVAMNTVVPLIPDLAARLNLSTTLAGFVASTWMFARLLAFVVLWRWTGWHYRFGWLLTSYAVMAGAFVCLLSISNLAVVIVAQTAFGLAVGLIYYSSLFYSMDIGEQSQGEHGGFHEALIGMGIFAGPAVGAAALQFLPTSPNAGIWAVGGLLMVGLAGLLRIKPNG
jgi:predicted MFS family arabinose efflux permease